MINSSARLFKRHSTLKYPLTITCLDISFNFIENNIKVEDLSFNGCRLLSPIPFGKGPIEFIITLGTHKLNFTGNLAWEKSKDEGYQSGLRVSFKDKDSFSKWCKLLLALEKIEKKRVSKKKPNQKEKSVLKFSNSL